MIIKKTSSIIKNIWDAFLIIFLLFIFVFIILQKGFFIEKLYLPLMRVEGLYIKFDKKFIVRANNIIITKKERSKDAKSEISEIIKKIKYFKTLFKELSVERVSFQDNIIRFSYLNDIFDFDSKYLRLNSYVDSVKDTLYMNINGLYLKEYNLTLKGELKANPINDSGYFEGDFNVFNISGNAKLLLRNNRIDYYLSTKEFDSLTPFMKFLESKIYIHPKISSWIYKKIVARKYKLRYFEGSYDLKNKRFFFEDMKALAEAEKAKIFFHPKLKEVNVKKIVIFFDEGNLRFKLKEPFYYDKNLTGSFVKISSVTKPKNSSIEIILRTVSPFDKRIKEILKAYKIEVPLIQKKGKTEGFLSIKIPRFKKENIDLKGEFVTKGGEFVLAGVLFKVKNANLFLDNTRLVFKNIKDFSYKDLFDVNLNGVLDLKKMAFDGDIFINSFKLKKGNFEILNVKGVNSSVGMNFSKDGFSLFIPNFLLKAYFSDKSNVIRFKYLSKFYPYSPFLKEYGLKKGRAKISTKDFKKYEIEAKVKDLRLPFLKKNGDKISDLELNIVIDENLTFIKDKNSLFQANISDEESLIKIKNVDFLVERELTEKALKKDSLDKRERKITILAENSDVIFNDKKLGCLSYNAIVKKSKMDFECSFSKNGKLFFIKENDFFNIFTKNLDFKFINSFLQKRVFIGGKFDLKMRGNLRNFEGKFSFSDTVLRDFEVFNNLMAFINTIPSLLFLQNPNFSSNGYKIKNGEIEFVKIENILTFTKIAIKGYSADINGLGYLNLSNDKIDLNLEISTLQNIDKIIKHIPIVGYIILGKDGRNSVGVKVKGNFKDPKVETYLVKDIFKMPLNILKRTLDFPFMLFTPSRNR